MDIIKVAIPDSDFIVENRVILDPDIRALYVQTMESVKPLSLHRISSPTTMDEQYVLTYDSHMARKFYISSLHHTSVSLEDVIIEKVEQDGSLLNTLLPHYEDLRYYLYGAPEGGTSPSLNYSHYKLKEDIMRLGDYFYLKF